MALGGLAAAGGGAALLIGRLSGSRWAGRVVGVSGGTGEQDQTVAEAAAAAF
ncbi:hypothetical protein GBA65_10545 [Rubrobacter marinus]|uniref:Uncharacterized protein n=1 Tax=Rubrobacter marinus TaxID=2653852 RepID=A0A6G8PXH7_9ACTN|nr:hypothetical protein GBA65_10545 [Rubrobacter marinus]